MPAYAQGGSSGEQMPSWRKYLIGSILAELPVSTLKWMGVWAGPIFSSTSARSEKERLNVST